MDKVDWPNSSLELRGQFVIEARAICAWGGRPSEQEDHRGRRTNEWLALHAFGKHDGFIMIIRNTFELLLLLLLLLSFWIVVLRQKRVDRNANARAFAKLN